MSTQADVVKKSNLKLKVVRGKSASNTPAVQGPKAFKDFWFVFRSLNGGEKVLEYHPSERKFQECAAYPKGVVHLGSALTVSYHNPEKKQQFSIELSDGSLIFLEASSESLAREWMNCLNAVLFGKGTGPNGALQYFVEVAPGSRLHHTGPCMLEVRDGNLVVKTRDGAANLVRWKLAHIRSFKAKKDVLTVYSGTRSSTGVGEYVFNTSQSVQITHAIETIVKKLREDVVQQPQSASGQGLARPYFTEHRRPLPPPPAPTNCITECRPHSPPLAPATSEVSIISSLAGVPDYIPGELLSEDSRRSQWRKNIPAFRSPEYSEVGKLATPPPDLSSQEYSVLREITPEGQGYERLDLTKPPSRKSMSPPQDTGGYSHLNYPQQRASSRNASGSTSPPPLPPARHSPSKEASDDDSPYGRLDHGTGPGRKQAPQSRSSYDKLDFSTKEVGGEGLGEEDYDTLNTCSPAIKRTPPKPPPYKPRADPSPSKQQTEIYSYAEVSDAVHPKQRDVYTEIPPSIPKEVSEGYGRLNHTHTKGPLPPSQGEGYSKLDVKPRPQSNLDPYASLSDSNINELSEAIRQANGIPETSEANSAGEYSMLQSSVTPAADLEIDEKGYSKPWTSYTVTTVTSVNETPAPTVNGHNDRSTKSTEAAGGTVFESLYDAVADTFQGNRERKPSLDPIRGRKNSGPPPPPRSHPAAT